MEIMLAFACVFGAAMGYRMYLRDVKHEVMPMYVELIASAIVIAAIIGGAFIGYVDVYFALIAIAIYVVCLRGDIKAHAKWKENK